MGWDSPSGCTFRFYQKSVFWVEKGIDILHSLGVSEIKRMHKHESEAALPQVWSSIPYKIYVWR